MSNFKESKQHGTKYSIEYSSWRSMKQRCTNQNHKFWKYYGGRGIKICKEWMDSFKAFYNCMGKRPSLKHSLDRIDNDGNYEPGNVRWATTKEQANNKRSFDQNGEKGSVHKLTEEQVLEIRKLYNSGDISQRKLGDLYGVEKTSIGNIVNRKTWKHI